MCIAIFKPAGRVLTEATLRTCFNSNPDGAGFAYINTDHLGVKRIKMYKSMEFAPFYKQYERATRIAPDSAFLVHFRIKTHGQKDIANCHPFMIDEDTVFIHNGIIGGVSRHADKSDTRMFNEEVLREMPEGWLYNPAIAMLIEEFIGASKLAVLSISGEGFIFNEKKGHWHEGIWMSNDSYKERPVYTTKYGGYQGHYNAQPRTLPNSTVNTAAWSINAFTREDCEYCNQPFQIKDMHAYEDKDAPIMLVCEECKKSLEKAGAVSNKNKTTMAKYLTEANIQLNKEKAIAAKKVAAIAEQEEAWQDYQGMYN